MAESLEYQTLVRCRSKLVTGLQLDPANVADELISRRLIPPSVGSEMSDQTRSNDVKARRLVDCVFTKIEISSDSYRNFIDAFTECGWLDDLIGILNATHRELSSAVDVPEGADQTEQPQSQAEQSTVADSTKEAEGLVQSQTQTDLAVIQSNEEEIKAQFSLLLINVKKELKSENIDVSDVYEFLVNFFQKDDCFPSATMITYDSIFRATTVSRLWDYQHYSPLEKLTSHLLPNNPAVTSLIANYKASLTGFMMITELIPYMRQKRLEEVAEQQSSMKPLKPEHYRQITFVLNLGRRVSQLSLLYVQKLWMSVAEEYELPCLTAIVDSITSGSLRITWLVLPSVMSRFSVHAKFFKKEKIVQVFVDNVIFYDEIEMMDHEQRLLEICLQNKEGITQFSDILEKGVDPDVHDEKYGCHPLWYASYYGRRDLVELLILKSKADVNLANESEFGETALITAIGHNHLGTASLLLDLGANVNQKNKKGKSPLWCASNDGKDDIVLLLLEHNAQIDLPTEDELGDTALIAAVQQGHLTTAALLLDHGADVNKQNKEGQSPLWSASYDGKDDLVLLLLEHNAQIDLPTDDEFGETALFAASQEGHLTTAALLLDHGADVNKQRKDGNTPLYFASMTGHAELVELLLKRGAHLNQGTSPPLYAASHEGKVDIVKRLIRHGADVNLPTQDDEFGSTPLRVACGENHLKVVTVLIENGAVVDSTDKKGMSALHTASSKGNTDVVHLLLKYHAQLEIKNNEGRTALMLASWRGHLKIVKVLLGAGAETDVQDQEGLTSLMLATKNGHTDVAKALLEAKVDPNLREKNSGWSALFFSVQEGHLKIAELLIAAGAVVDRKDKDDATAYVIAEVNGHSDLCELLEKHSKLQRETETAVTEEQHKQVKKSYQRLLKIFDLLEDTLLKDRKEKRLHQANQRNVSTLADVNEN